MLKQTAGRLDLNAVTTWGITSLHIWSDSPLGQHGIFFSFSLEKLANYGEVRLIPTYWPLTNSEAVSFELCLKHLPLTPSYASHLLLTQWIKFLLYFRHQTHRLVLATFVTSAPDKRLCKHLGLFSARGQRVGSTHANFDSAPQNSSPGRLSRLSALLTTAWVNSLVYDVPAGLHGKERREISSLIQAAGDFPGALRFPSWSVTPMCSFYRASCARALPAKQN